MLSISKLIENSTCLVNLEILSIRRPVYFSRIDCTVSHFNIQACLKFFNSLFS